MQDPLFNEYLNVNEIDRSVCLEKSFYFLRQSWTTRWVGLPALLIRCFDFLNLSKISLTTDASQMLLAAQSVAQNIELQSTLSHSKPEPKYHNRLHTADVLTAMSVLINIQSQIQKNLDQEWVACALLSAVAHDFGHPGQINYSESEIELQTINKLKPFLSNHKVTSFWCDALEAAILKSDFSLVQKNHESVRGKEFACDERWLIVFLNEADVMASASDKFGPQLGNLLAEEWRLIDFPAYQSVATDTGRKTFLRQLEFSSAASRLLRINANIGEQLVVKAQ
jgi:hypothetical protein